MLGRGGAGGHSKCVVGRGLHSGQWAIAHPHPPPRTPFQYFFLFTTATTHCPLPIGRLSTIYCPLPTVQYPLPMAHCQCPLPTVHSPLSTAHCLLPTAYCPLPTAYCLLLKAQWVKGYNPPPHTCIVGHCYF